MQAFKEPSLWNVSLAFLKRDFQESLSYRMNFAFELLALVSNLLIFFFIGKVFGGEASPHLAKYGGEYFPFVLVGIAFAGFQAVAINSFAEAIQREQDFGTLEAILITPTSLFQIMVSGSLWSFLFAMLRSITYCVAGILFFGANFSQANFLAVFVTIALMIFSLTGFGVMSAGYILVYKRGNPVNAFLNNVSKFLGGVYFPLSVLPAFILPLCHWFPLTHGLEALRKSLLQGVSFSELLPQWGALTLFGLILLPLSLWIFQKAIARAKSDGSLAFQ